MYLSYELVIDYIKRNLGYPVATVELSDEEIIHVVKTITMPYFSSYVPDYNQKQVTKTVEGSSNVYIIEEEESAIIDVVKIMTDISNEIVTGDPRQIMPLLSPSSIPSFLTDLTVRHLQQQYSNMWPSWKFIPPNLVRIYPSYNMGGIYIVRYTRVHPSPTTIPVNYQRDFQDLALSDVMFSLYAVRAKYSTYQTPYGDINLNADVLYQRATDLKNVVIERLKRKPPDTILYVR